MNDGNSKQQTDVCLTLKRKKMPNYKTLETFPAKISLPNFAKKIFEEEEKRRVF